MNAKLLIISAIFGLCAFLSPATRAAESLEVLEEKINRLTSLVEDLEFRQKKLEEQLDKVKEDLRSIGGGDNSADLKALQDRIAAIDAAREKDKRIIIDELSRQLAAISSGKTVSGNEHIVAKGETLSSIAKAKGCTVAELKRANNLTGDNLAVGQKLSIPQK